MSKENEQPAEPTSSALKSTIIVVITMLVITTLMYHAPGHWITGVIILSLAVGLFAYVWLLSREFSLRCLSIAGSALFALLSNNIIPNLNITGNWGETSFGFKIESIDASINWILGIIIIAFGILAYMYRRPTPEKVISNNPTMQIKKVSGNPTGPNSPAVVIGDVIYDQSGAKLDDETTNAIIKQQLKTITEKDAQLSEKDDLIHKFSEGTEHAKRKVEIGEKSVQDIINELRESGDTEKLQRVLEKEAKQHKDDFIERCLEISAIAFLRGDIDTARTRANDVLKLDPDEIRALNQLGHIEHLQGNLDAAESAYRRMLDVGELTNELHLISVASGNLGILLRARGDLDGAENMYRKAMEIAEELGDLEGMANQYGNLGNVLATRGDLDGAENMYRKSLEINEKLDHIEGMAREYGNLGIVFKMRGDLDGAEEMHRKALKINEKLARLEGMANQYGNLGLVLQTRGDLDGAEQMHNKALEIDEKLKNLEGIASDYSNLGVVYKDRGDKKKAKEYYIKARDLFKQIGMQLQLKKVQGMIDKLENPDAP